jgi:hypothetical protein
VEEDADPAKAVEEEADPAKAVEEEADPAKAVEEEADPVRPAEEGPSSAVMLAAHYAHKQGVSLELIQKTTEMRIAAKFSQSKSAIPKSPVGNAALRKLVLALDEALKTTSPELVREAVRIRVGLDKYITGPYRPPPPPPPPAEASSDPAEIAARARARKELDRRKADLVAKLKRPEKLLEPREKIIGELRIIDEALSRGMSPVKILQSLCEAELANLQILLTPPARPAAAVTKTYPPMKIISSPKVEARAVSEIKKYLSGKKEMRKNALELEIQRGGQSVCSIKGLENSEELDASVISKERRGSPLTRIEQVRLIRYRCTK